MNKLELLEKILEDYNDDIHKILHAKTRIHSTEQFLRDLKAKLSSVQDPARKKSLTDRIRDHENILASHKHQLATLQAKVSKSKPQTYDGGQAQGHHQAASL